MGATDALLSRYTTEIEERQKFIDGLVEEAQSDSRDLDPKELELITRARDRIAVVHGLISPLREASRISRESAEMTAQMAAEMQAASKAAALRNPAVATPVEYRSAGSYVLDRWRAGLGAEEALTRLELFHRAAAHQTTADNPGLLPEQIMGPVVNFVDTARPLVSALGPRDLPAGSWSRPRVTQHTQVGAQSAEKTELVSRKMLIGKVPVTAVTLGGYVNVSRQDIDWSQPQIMDIVIADLAAQYALESENKLADDLAAAATAGGTIPAAPTGADVAGAVWESVGLVYGATSGQGRLLIACSPDMLGLIGPLFAPINPQNAQSSGFTAGAFGQGAMGAISGISVVVSAGFAAGTILVLSTAAAEVYEDRIGALQVVEPSVLGVQVAYAGYFADLIMEANGIREITVTP